MGRKKKTLKFLQALGPVLRGVRANMSQKKSKRFGTLPDLHSTLWELKASFSENVKASSSCNIFSLSSAVGETDFKSFPLKPSFLDN